MSGSMGSIMMTWTSELIKQGSKKKRKEMLRKKSFRAEKEEKVMKEEEKEKENFQNMLAAVSCVDCDSNREMVSNLEKQISSGKVLQAELESQLEGAQNSLLSTVEREKALRQDVERLEIEGAQVRYELKEHEKTHLEEMEKWSKVELEQRGTVEQLEQLLKVKESEWLQKEGSLHKDLENAMRTNVDLSNFESMTRTQLEQEIHSLRTVIEIRTGEIHEVRRVNAELGVKLERHYWLEKELDKTRQRVEEMNLVVQNKMVAEKELIDMTEDLTNQLSRARNEILSLRRNLENIQYMKNVDLNMDEKRIMMQQNRHQKASSCGKNGEDPSLVLDLVTKNEGVAWMLHVPDSPKLATKK